MDTSRPRPSANAARKGPAVIFGMPVEQILTMRGISKADVLKALSSGSFRTDSKTGHDVFRSGDLRIVVKRDDNRLIVLTAMRAADFAEHAG